MRPTTLLATALAVLAPLALARPAAAAPPVAAPQVAPGGDPAVRLLDLLDADATLVITFRPRALWTLDEWLGKFDGAMKPLVQGLRAEAATSLERELGVNPLAQAAWTAAGLDPTLPIVAGLGALDHVAARKAFDVLAKQPKSRIKTPFWRSRFVLGLTDEAAFRKALATAAEGPDWARVEGPPDALAKALRLGDKPAAGAGAIRAQLAARRVLAIWRPSGDTIGFLRVEGGVVIGDVFSPFARAALDPAADLPALLKLLVRPPSKRKVSATLAAGSGRALLQADAGVWTTPDRVLDLGQALGRQSVLNAFGMELDAAQRSAIVAQGAAEVGRCDDLRALPRSLGAVDGAWTVDVAPRKITMRLTTSLDPKSPLPAALPAADDGLLDVVTSADAPAVAAYYGTGLAGLRALPRPGLLARTPDDVARAVQECGGPGLLALAAFAWPHLILFTIDDAPTEVRTVLASLRNVAVAWKQFGATSAAHVGVFVGSFEPGVGSALERLLDALGATRGVRKAGPRKLDTWARAGEPTAFKTQLGDRLAAGGALGGTKALDWFWGRSSPRGAPGQPPALAVLRVDVPQVLRQLEGQLGISRPMLDAVTKRLGQLAGSLKVAPAGEPGGGLRAELELELR